MDPSGAPPLPNDAARRDRSVSMLAANAYSLVLIVPPVAALAALYAWRWGDGALWAMLALRGFAWMACLIALVAGIVAHEGLHGLAWAVFGKKPLTAIKFGFQVKTLTPYAHCREPMTVRAYRIGAATPGLVLGMLPAGFGIAAGLAGPTAFGLLFTLAAGGDALILWLLRREAPDALVEDHPSRAGCYVLDAVAQAVEDPE